MAGGEASRASLINTLETIPKGAEDLFLRILILFAEKFEAPPALISLVLRHVKSKKLDVKYLIPVTPQMDKVTLS